MNDMEVLQRAYDRENDTRNKGARIRGWEAHSVGGSRATMLRLVDGGLVEIVVKERGYTTYRLTEKGIGLVAIERLDQEESRIPASTVLEALELVVGYDDLKGALADAVESRSRTNFLLEGPPACAKSVLLEGVRAAVPDAYMAFGSRTSAPGLSDALFEYHPSVLLLDEADKMPNDVYAVLLGLMESGEVLETKSRKTRGIKLNTTVLAACNSSAKMPPEFLSRFALHAVFPLYTRVEFINVCRGFLKAEGCPEEYAAFIGKRVYDYGLGDVRKARGVWALMKESTEDEVDRVVNLMLRYSGDLQKAGRRVEASGERMEGM